MNLKQYYEEIALRIKDIDFFLLWPGFKKYNFALYDNEKVYFNHQEIKKTNEFLGNTAIKFNNEHIAIWNLTNHMDYDILTAKIIHEMFHAFQKEQNESRFPNEFLGVINYQYDLTNSQIKLKENQILKELLSCFEPKLLTEFYKLRRYRKEYFSFEYDYETNIETIEGSAQFVELMALKYLNIDKFKNQLNQILKRIIDPRCLIPIRVRCYDIGAILLLICEQNNILLNKNIDYYLNFSDQLLNNIPVEDINIPYNALLEEVLHKDMRNLEELINKTKLKNNVIKIEPSKLAGFNVYQARYLKGYLYSKYFIMYNNGIKDIILEGDYIVKLNDMIIEEIYQIN